MDGIEGEEEFWRAFGGELKRARAARNLTQADVAKALGMHRASYANIEGGKSRINVRQLYFLIGAIGFQPSKVPVEKTEAYRVMQAEIDHLRFVLERGRLALEENLD